MLIAIALFFSVILFSIFAYAQTNKTLYGSLEQEQISAESQELLKSYYEDILRNAGVALKFNTLSAKDNIAIMNLTIDGKDRRVLTKLSNAQLIDSSLASGLVNNLRILGNLAVLGISYYNAYSDFGERKLFSTASTSPRFTDEGTSRLFNGIGNVSINPVFRSLIDGYKVYVSPEGRTRGIYVAEKANDYFIVKSISSSSNVKFSWLISGNRKADSMPFNESHSINAYIDYEAERTQINLTDGYSNSSTEYALNSTDEKEIVKQVSAGSGISENTVKERIQFHYNEPIGFQDEEESAQAPKSYIERNGSVSIRLG